MSNKRSVTPETTFPLRSESCTASYKDVRVGTRHRGSPPWFSLMLRFLSGIASNARILRAELGSLIHRMRALRDKNSQHRVSLASADVGPLFEWEETGAHLRPCRETYARIQSIERMLSKFPWASAGDTLLFLEGWEMGKQFALGNACNTSMGTERASCHPANSTISSSDQT